MMIDFLQVKNSGLKVMFRPMDGNNAGNWKPQYIDTDKMMKDEDCN